MAESLERSYNRRLRRHSIDSMLVEVFDRDTQIYLGRLVNLHREGLMLMGDVTLNADKLYHLDLHLPKLINGSDHIQFTADCLWSKDSEDHSKHWAGCSILDISPQALMDIEALVIAIEPNALSH